MGGVDESVLRTFTVACEADFALPAISRQGITLVQAEAVLLLGASQGREGVFHNVPQPVLRIDVMVAGVHVPVMLDGHRSTAGFPKHAEVLRHPHPTFQSDVEDLDEILPHITTHPFVENRA